MSDPLYCLHHRRRSGREAEPHRLRAQPPPPNAGGGGFSGGHPPDRRRPQQPPLCAAAGCEDSGVRKGLHRALARLRSFGADIARQPHVEGAKATAICCYLRFQGTADLDCTVGL